LILPTLRFLALPAREQGCALEAGLSLLAVRLVFWLLPFRYALQFLRIARGKSPTSRVCASTAAEISQAIVRGARHVPFRAVCLQQAFAALLMLRRRGLAGRVHVGLARNNGAEALKAHAWCLCGDVPVAGVEVAHEFVSIAIFFG
jgi:hypothetical protein